MMAKCAPLWGSWIGVSLSATPNPKGWIGVSLSATPNPKGWIGVSLSAKGARNA